MKPKSEKESEFIWCLVGNIVDEHPYGESREIVKGTKQFSPGTKVYCFPPQWGDGYEQIEVIGQRRVSHKLIKIVMASKCITNWRIQKIYKPAIIELMKSHYGWMDSIRDKEKIETLLKGLLMRNE